MKYLTISHDPMQTCEIIGRQGKSKVTLGNKGAIHIYLVIIETAFGAFHSFEKNFFLSSWCLAPPSGASKVRSATPFIALGVVLGLAALVAAVVITGFVMWRIAYVE